MMKRRGGLVLVYLTVGLSLFLQSGVSLASSATSKVGIYFTEVTSEPSPNEEKKPLKLPQTSTSRQNYLVIIGGTIISVSSFSFKRSKQSNRK